MVHKNHSTSIAETFSRHGKLNFHALWSCSQKAHVVHLTTLKKISIGYDEKPPPPPPPRSAVPLSGNDLPASAAGRTMHSAATGILSDRRARGGVPSGERTPFLKPINCNAPPRPIHRLCTVARTRVHPSAFAVPRILAIALHYSPLILSATIPSPGGLPLSLYRRRRRRSNDVVCLSKSTPREVRCTGDTERESAPYLETAEKTNKRPDDDKLPPLLLLGSVKFRNEFTY